MLPFDLPTNCGLQLFKIVVRMIFSASWHFGRKTLAQTGRAGHSGIDSMKALMAQVIFIVAIQQMYIT